MKIEPDESAFDWIRSGRSNRPKSTWTGIFVSHLIPPIFESYSKILHRVEAQYHDIDHPFTQAENAILRIPTCEPLRSFVESRGTDPLKRRVKWGELAVLFNVPFTSEICHEWYRKTLEDPCWPHLLAGPGDGVLSDEECTELSSTLMPFTNSEECFFRFSEVPLITSGGPQLFKGALSEVCGFPKGRALGFEYWWPPERDWCVCSNYDLEFTVVAGTTKLTSALLSSRVLECIEVNPQTRVDSSAPMPLQSAR